MGKKWRNILRLLNITYLLLLKRTIGLRAAKGSSQTSREKTIFANNTFITWIIRSPVRQVALFKHTKVEEFSRLFKEIKP